MNHRKSAMFLSTALIAGIASFALLGQPSPAREDRGTNWTRFKRDAGDTRQLFLQSPGSNTTYDFTAEDALFVSRIRVSYQSTTAAIGSQRLQISVAAPPDRTVPLAYFYFQEPAPTAEYTFDPPIEVGAGTRIVPTVTGDSPFLIEFYGTITAPRTGSATGTLVR